MTHSISAAPKLESLPPSAIADATTKLRVAAVLVTIRVMAFSSATRATSPLSVTVALANTGVSMSAHSISERQPVPRAFMTASLAAKAAVKARVRRDLGACWQAARSRRVKMRSMRDAWSRKRRSTRSTLSVSMPIPTINVLLSFTFNRSSAPRVQSVCGAARKCARATDSQ